MEIKFKSRQCRRCVPTLGPCHINLHPGTGEEGSEILAYPYCDSIIPSKITRLGYLDRQCVENGTQKTLQIEDLL